MAVETTVLSIADKIAALEPLSGAALAICLAYLALDRFRYRTIIREGATKELTPDLYQTDGVHHTTPFKTLVWLAGPTAPTGCQNGNSPRRPQGLEPACYGWLFDKPSDEVIVALFAFISFCILLGVVCINANIASWYISLISYFPPGLLFFLLVIGAIAPVAFVLLGRRCVSWAEVQSREMAEELQNTAQRMQGEARQLPVPIAEQPTSA